MLLYVTDRRTACQVLTVTLPTKCRAPSLLLYVDVTPVLDVIADSTSPSRKPLVIVTVAVSRFTSTM